MAPFIILAGTPLILLSAAVLLRRRAAALRWAVAVALFVVITALWASDTTAPQSGWVNVPLIAGATFGSFYVAALSPFEKRPLVALVASLCAGALGFFVGMVVSIEMGWLRP